MPGFLLGVVSTLSSFSLASALLRRTRRAISRRRLLAFAALPPPLLPPSPPLYENMESAWWLNRALSKLFRAQSAHLAELLLNHVLNPLVRDLPAPPIPLHFTRLALGGRAPQVHHVKTFRTNDEVSGVLIDFDVDWITTFFELGVGAQLLGGAAVVPVARVADLTFRGKFRVQMAMGRRFGEIREVSLSLVQKPDVDFAIEPVATGVDVMNIPAISSWLRDFLAVVICELILWPKRHTFNFKHDQEPSAAHPSPSPPMSECSSPPSTPADDVSSILASLSMAATMGEEVDEGSPGAATPQSHPATPSVRHAQAMAGKVTMARQGLSAAVTHPPGTVGVLQIRLCEASQLGGNQPPPHLESVNPYVSFRLGSELVSSQRYRRTNFPTFDEYFELYVKDPLSDLVEIRVYHESEQVVDRVNNLFRDKLVGSSWISVEEVTQHQGWVDLWLPLQNGDYMDPAVEAPDVGFLRLQLAYDAIYDPKDTEADARLRATVANDRCDEQDDLGLQDAFGIDLDYVDGERREIAGVWQIHLLEGCQWRRENVTARVSDARCDLKCAGQTKRSRPSYDSKNPSWGEFFEFPVRSAITDVLSIVGVDEDPFAKDNFVGRAVLALSGVGDVEPKEMWLRLKRKSAEQPSCTEGENVAGNACRPSSRVGGWIRVWVGFKSFYQDCTRGDWTSSDINILVNPSISDLRQRFEIAEREEFLTTAPQAAKDVEHDSASMLLSSLSNLNPSYLVNLAERLPRSLMKYGAHMVWDRVIKPVFPDNPHADGSDSSADGDQLLRAPSVGSMGSGEGSVVAEEAAEAVRSTPIPMSQDIQVLIVTFVTGDVYLAGTKARVWIEFHNNGLDHRVVADRDSDSFRRGAADRFVMEIPKELGQPSHVVVGHDNSGLSPSWYLERVEIRKTCGESNDPVWESVFQCGRWIGARRSEQKGRTVGPLRAQLFPS